MAVFQHGFTGERREVTGAEQIAWYENSGGPWYRADPAVIPTPNPPSVKATEAKAPAKKPKA